MLLEVIPISDGGSNIDMSAVFCYLYLVGIEVLCFISLAQLLYCIGGGKLKAHKRLRQVKSVIGGQILNVLKILCDIGKPSFKIMDII